MPFFQNPFASDFEANWLLGDRHHMPKFVLKGNTGRGLELVSAWKLGPYNLSGNDSDGMPRKYLNVVYRLYNTKNWANLTIDVTNGAADVTAVTTLEILTALRNNSTFNEKFVADMGSANDASDKKIRIKQKRPITEFEFYVKNGQAEQFLGFNAKAGIAELPTYFAMHTIANRFTFPASEGRIIQLAPDSSAIDAELVDNAVDALGKSMGYDHNIVQEDWQLLRGRSGLFSFIKGPSTGAVTSTETTIVYPAGAKIGDLAEKTIVRKDTNGVAVETFNMPYTLTAGDMIVPPDVFNQVLVSDGMMASGAATVA